MFFAVAFSPMWLCSSYEFFSLVCAEVFAHDLEQHFNFFGCCADRKDAIADLKECGGGQEFAAFCKPLYSEIQAVI
jgi:hypothetical protein